MSYAQQAINSLDQTINSFKSRVDVKVSDVSTSTANIQATTNRIYENIERFKNDLMHGEESQIAHENILSDLAFLAMHKGAVQQPYCNPQNCYGRCP